MRGGTGQGKMWIMTPSSRTGIVRKGYDENVGKETSKERSQSEENCWGNFRKESQCDGVEDRKRI